MTLEGTVIVNPDLATCQGIDDKPRPIFDGNVLDEERMAEENLVETLCDRKENAFEFFRWSLNESWKSCEKIFQIFEIIGFIFNKASKQENTKLNVSMLIEEFLQFVKI